MIPKSKSSVFQTASKVAEPCPMHPVPRLNGTIHALSHIIRAEGLRGLYSGLPPMLIIAVPSTVFYFTSYDMMLSMAKKKFPKETHPFLPLFAGSFARCIAATVVSPLELIRTRMQASPHSQRFLKELRMACSGGFFSLWKGLAPTLARDVPFSAIYWASFEGLKVSLSEKLQHKLKSENMATIKNTQLGVAFASGAIAGSIATIITQPFDVVKTRQQIEIYSAPIIKSDLNLPGVQHTVKQDGVVQTVLQIAKTEGLAGVMSGLSARVAKVAPACAIMISTYEAGKQYLGVE